LRNISCIPEKRKKNLLSKTPTFYASVFHTKVLFFAKILSQSQNVTRKSCAVIFRTKNARENVDEIDTCLFSRTQTFNQQLFCQFPSTAGKEKLRKHCHSKNHWYNAGEIYTLK